MFFIYLLTLILPIVITVAFYTLAERKLIAAMQRRTGPNIIGFWGLLQPFADGLKAILKEQFKPLRSVFYLFLFAPILTFFISLLALNFICFNFTRSYFDEYLNFFFFLSISSFNVFGIILAGWTSNSKYTLLGSLRAAAQTFSFEMCFITLLLPIFLLNSSFNLIDIVLYQQNYWNIFIFFPTTLYFFIILLAETNRTPFDLPEAEAELVAGYNLEYSAINFALFFLGEYTNMLLNSCIFVIFFLGGWLIPSSFLLIINFIKIIFISILTNLPNILLFISLSLLFNNNLNNLKSKYNKKFLNFLKNIIIIFLLIFILFLLTYLITNNLIFFNIKVIFVSTWFILVRAILPRYRFDQLMDLCWKKILPVSSSFFLFFIYIIYIFNGFSYSLEIMNFKTKFLTIYFFKIS